jgi:hypothetical protein
VSPGRAGPHGPRPPARPSPRPAGARPPRPAGAPRRRGGPSGRGRAGRPAPASSGGRALQHHSELPKRCLRVRGLAHAAQRRQSLVEGALPGHGTGG